MDKVIPLALRRESIDIIIGMMKNALDDPDNEYSDNVEKQAFLLIKKFEELSAIKK